MAPVRVAIGPRRSRRFVQAVTDGGGEAVAVDEEPEALVWLDPNDVEGLAAALRAAPGIRWVQLPFAGVENVVSQEMFDGSRLWTCAKGAYAEPVAEHALALALAGLRMLPRRIKARSWGQAAGISLFDQPVTILGGGGITRALIPLLAPFRAEVTVVRRTTDPVPGAHRTLPTSGLAAALPGAAVVFLALALSPATTGIIGRDELALMEPTAWLVNVARGRHVQTDALVEALDSGGIAGAALDVTDPEPLPDGHPLWGRENCIVTPHTADTPEMTQPLLAARVRENVARFAAGQDLVGIVDPLAGY